MIVNCDSCGSRFRLEEGLLKGARGARVRCRKCGEAIVLMNSGTPKDDSSRDVYSVEDLFRPPSGEEPVGAQAAAAPPGKPRRLFLVAATVALALLGAAGARYLFLSDRIPQRGPRPASAPVASPPEYEVRDVKGEAVIPPGGRELFVLRGSVVNVGRAQGGSVSVRATLLGTDNQVVGEGTAIAGNLIDKALLPHMDADRVQEYLESRYTSAEASHGIPAGGSLPFMVVFFGPSAPVGSFEVRATDADANPSEMHLSSPVTAYPD